MNTFAIQTGTSSYGAPGLVGMPIAVLEAVDQKNGNALPRFQREIESQIEVYEFRGRLDIPGAPFVIPEQDFIATVTTDKTITFENHPASPWPRFSIELEMEPATGKAQVRFQIRPVESSTDSEIAYTRVQFVLGKIRRCVLQFDDGEDILPFRFDPPVPTDEQQLLYRATIFRKLKYIEQEVFRTKFFLPKELSTDDVAAIEFIFRAVTEGEFTTRQQEITLPLDPSKVDLSKPPFDGPGLLTHRSEVDWLELFGQRLLIGNPVVTLRHAEAASPQAIRQIRQGQRGPIWMRFSILDHQIHYRVDGHATEPAKRLQQQRLKFFRQELSKNEPMELANLLDEPLMADVSAEEAYLIAVGWTQYNKLPDRYCPQEPEHNSLANIWRVPIKFGYPTGQSGEVGELLIDGGTGKIISHTSIEEMRSRGRTLAKAFLHAT